MTRLQKKAVKKRKPTQTSASASTDSPSDRNAADFTDNMAKSAQLWQELISHMACGFIDNPNVGIGHTDPMHMGEPFVKLAGHLATNPHHLYNAQISLLKDHVALWQNTTERLLGRSKEDKVEPIVADRRFKDDAWSQNTYFDYLKRSYLINSKWLQKSVTQIEGLDEHTANKLSFFTRQFLDAVSPSNFVLTNPEVLRTTLESKGENLVKGLENMLEDVHRGQGKLRIRMADENAFKLGKDLAATPGSVVYENDLMQLIQYKPTTKKVHEVPLLLVPAWINKFYVLDLREQNSLVKWAVDQGYTVFIISWVNPDEELAQKQFENYLEEGPLTALDVIENITKSKKTNVVGYCLGGTLTSILLAYLRAKGQQDRIGAASFLTTLVDFSKAGELSVFIDEPQLESLEGRMNGRGFLESEDMATTFNMLRANDLIWSFFVNNYLLGKDPFPFDLLYWNSDSTRMPAKMHSFYLRKMYQKNLLCQPNGIELLDTPINITKIDTPAYILSTKEDHIAPWQSTYLATQIYDGPVTFVLAQSGHVAGVISSPTKQKYGYWANASLPLRSEQWLENAEFNSESWWLHWNKWMQSHNGQQVPARKVGSKKYPIIEDAPGAYVRIRS